jgi:hypothetical protein
LDQGSLVRYHVVHKLHKVSAESKTVEGKALVAADGGIKVMVRVPVQSFDSGDKNRDVHMFETVEAGKFPSVTVKAVGKIALPTTFPATVEAPLTAEVEFHGEKREEKFPVTLEFLSADKVNVKGSFTFSLERYKIERPSLLFVKVDDACVIDIALQTSAAK